MVHADLFFVQILPQNSSFRGLTKFSQNYTVATLLILIESPNILHWKSARNSKVDVVLGTKFGPDLVQCCEKIKKLALSIDIFIFYMWNTKIQRYYRNTFVEI